MDTVVGGTKTLPGVVRVGNNNYIPIDSVEMVFNSKGMPAQRIYTGFKNAGKVLDLTSGKKRRSMLLTRHNWLVICSSTPEVVAKNVSKWLCYGRRVVRKDT